MLWFDVSVHDLFGIEVTQSCKTVLDDLANKFSCMDTLVLHHIFKSPTRQVLSNNINEIVSFIKPIILNEVRMINLPESLDFVFQSLFSFELNFLSFIRKNFSCFLHFGVLMFDEVNCCESSPSETF